MPNVTCSNCGTEFDSKEKKCPSCGTKNSLKICPICGGQMAKSAKRCPKCGAKNKKPFYKRWWFWCIVVCVMIFALENGKETNSVINNKLDVGTDQTQENKEQDAIIGTWYPYRYLDRSEETIKDATGLQSEVIVKDDYSLEIVLNDDTYNFTWAFYKEDEDGRYYTLTADSGESVFAALPSEDSELFDGIEIYRNSLVILLKDDGLFCRRENMEGDTKQGNVTSSVYNSASASFGEQNALKKAHQYLEYNAFSYTGLIDQLEFEGFSTNEATYAADACGVDWNEQAALKAQQYLKYSAFSRSELIDQLEFEGFTHSQAVYGVEQNGY